MAMLMGFTMVARVSEYLDETPGDATHLLLTERINFETEDCHTIISACDAHKHPKALVTHCGDRQHQKQEE